MTDSDWLQIIFFAALAVFFLIRLRQVLGQRTGNEQKYKHHKILQMPLPGQKHQTENVAEKSNIENEQEKSFLLSAELVNNVYELQRQYPAFQPSTFVKGAKIAFEAILEAYAAGDTNTLKALVDQDMFDLFDQAIITRQQKGQRQETMIVAIKEAKIRSIQSDAARAVISVIIVSEQINAIRNQQGQVIEGDATAVMTVRDLWTFAKDLRRTDPNWLLITTENAEA